MVICWERAVPLAFHLWWFYFSAVLTVGVPFPFGVEFDCIGSWSLPFYLLCSCAGRFESYLFGNHRRQVFLVTWLKWARVQQNGIASEGPDKSAHPHSLIRVFARHFVEDSWWIQISLCWLKNTLISRLCTHISSLWLATCMHKLEAYFWTLDIIKQSRKNSKRQKGRLIKGPYDKIWKFTNDAYFWNFIHVEPFLKISTI